MDLVDVLPYIFGFLPIAVVVYAKVLHPWWFPSVRDRAYTLGYSDGLAGKPHHTRVFNSEAATNGYAAGLDDARRDRKHRKQKDLERLDAELLDLGMCPDCGFPDRRHKKTCRASGAQADITTL